MRALLILAVVAGTATEVWQKARPATVRDGLAAVRKALSLTPKAVAELVATDPRFAREVRRTLKSAPPPPPPPRFGARTARAVPVSGPLIAAALALEGSAIRRDLAARLAALDQAGTPDGQLTPTELAAGDEVTRTVVHAIYRERWQRERPQRLPRGTTEAQAGFTMPLAELEQALPGAVAGILRGKTPPGKAFDAICVGAVSETLAHLAADYHAEVSTGTRTPTQFSVSRVLHHDGVWPSLVKQFPRLFPMENGQAEHMLIRELGREPAPPPATRIGDDEALADLVGARARAIMDASVLNTREDVIDALNADRDFVARHGPMTVVRLANLRARKRDAFPVFRDQERTFAVLAGELRALLRADPTLAAPDLVTVMQQRHPKFDQQWLRRVRQHNPDIVYRWRRDRVPHDREANARLLQRTLAANPRLEISEAGRLLAGEDERFAEEHYAHNLLRDFRDTVFGGAGPKRVRDPSRNGLAMMELFRLLSTVAPPGTSVEELGRAMDRLLAERGSPVTGDPLKVYMKYRNHLVGYEQPEERSARLAWQILHEYAAAAPKGMRAAEIVARVMRDYPSITTWRLGRYQGVWAKAGQTLALVGGGKTLARPRYLGGWDPLRALGDDPILARATQFARIPLRLPLLEDTLARLITTRPRPMTNHNVLWVSHLLGSTYALSRALVRAGMRTPRTIIVGTPYGTNDAVRAALADDGFDVRVPALSEREYRAAVKQALDDVLAKDGPIIVMDDGGFVADLLHNDPAYAKVKRAITIVEQTTAGIRKAESRSLRFPVINVARSLAKQEEAKLIGRAVAEKVAQGLGRLGRDLEGARVVVMGGGWVGSATAGRLRAQGADVVVLDPNDERQAAGNPGRTRLPSRAALLERADVVIGASGERSIDLEDLRRLKDGAVVLSASSKRAEIAMDELAAAASARQPIPLGPRVRLPTARYRLNGRSIVVLGDGWPVNFDGDVEDIPADEIQLTRAAMLAGALQAVSVNPSHFKNQRLLPLDPDVDRWLVGRYRELRRDKPDGPIGDPDAWRPIVSDLAGRFGSRK